MIISQKLSLRENDFMMKTEKTESRNRDRNNAEIHFFSRAKLEHVGEEDMDEQI